MGAPTSRTAGARLRQAADQLYDLAERADTEQRSLTAVQRLHDDIETVAGNVRAVVRGRAARPAVNPPLSVSADGLSAGW